MTAQPIATPGLTAALRSPSARRSGVTPPSVRLVPSAPDSDLGGAPAPGFAPGHDHAQVDPRMRRMMEHWVERYARTTLEIVAGERPAAHVARYTRTSVHQDLARRAVLATRAGAVPRAPGQDDSTPRPLVRRVHLSFITPRVVEAAVMVEQGETHRALACRFEWGRDRWRCTALEFC